MSLEGLTRAACWGVLAWALYGTMTYLLMARLASPGLDVALVSIGAYALSWVAAISPCSPRPVLVSERQ